jgi:hypothetical protein
VESSEASGSIGGMPETLETELARASAELRALMTTWEYAFAMAGGCRDGGHNHPMHRETRARAERLAAHCRELRARLAEQHEL